MLFCCLAPTPPLTITRPAPTRQGVNSHHFCYNCLIHITPALKSTYASLGLNTPEDLLGFIGANFTYGWRDQIGFLRPGTNDATSYSLQTPPELLDSKSGICWDLVELMRDWFETMTDYTTATYYLFYDDGAGCPAHTILTFRPPQTDRLYWIEPPYFGSAVPYDGIHSFEDEPGLIQNFEDYATRCFQLFGSLPADYRPENFHIYRYSKPPAHINGHEMRAHIETGTKIK